MISYTGEECFICKRKFTDEDDVVTCPECGTPYHRECYSEKKECVNHALHESGGSWMAESLEKKKAVLSVKKVCPDCSFINPEDAEQCRNCGGDLVNRECRTIDLSDQKVVRIELDADADYFGFNPMEIMDESTGITIGEMADYAKNNKLYYLLAFRRLKNAAVKFSVNLLAFLFPEIYCAGRKMFLQGAVIMLLRFIIQIPMFLDSIVHMEDMGFPSGIAMYANLISFAEAHAFSSSVLNITSALDITIRIVFGLMANEIYFRHTLSKLRKLRKNVPDYLRYRTVIKSCGGISIVGIVCTMLVQFLLASILMLVLMFLSYP